MEFLVCFGLMPFCGFWQLQRFGGGGSVHYANVLALHISQPPMSNTTKVTNFKKACNVTLHASAVKLLACSIIVPTT